MLYAWVEAKVDVTKSSITRVESSSRKKIKVKRLLEKKISQSHVKKWNIVEVKSYDCIDE